MTKTKKLKQFGTSFLIVLSLFVSAVSAACVCSHHQVKSETENLSCHHASSMAGMEMPNDNAESAVITPDDKCLCIQPAAKVFTKSETLKIEKQQAAKPLFFSFEIEKVAQTSALKTVFLEPSFYLSDSFYNLSPGRAPPSRL